MSKTAKTIITNLVYIILLDLILFPLGLALYLYHGFHVLHITIIMGYIYAFGTVISTANLMIANYRIISVKEYDEIIESQNDALESFEDESEHALDSIHYSTEPLKPSMQKAMDDVFNLKK